MSALDWFTSLISKGTSDLIDSVGSAIDRNVTSDEERLKLETEMKSIVLSFQQKQMGFLAQYDTEITNRHAADMKSDSWLSKNVRPLVLGFLTLSTVILAYITIFILDPSKTVLIQPWIDLLTVLLTTVYAFYFGSRGIEKVTRIKNNGT